jgi:protein-disulfide isomerase
MSRLRDFVSQCASLIIAVCAVVITVIVIKREFAGGGDRHFSNLVPPKRIENWRSISEYGHRIGPDNALITVTVFSNFECPACSYVALELAPKLKGQFPGDVAFIYRHWPLPGHRFAYQAALASECAAQQGRFWAFHDTLYAQQRLLGIKTFTEFAQDAGVPSMPEFIACMQSASPDSTIQADIELVQSLNGTGTPTLIINEWMIAGAVPEQVDAIIKIIAEKAK